MDFSLLLLLLPPLWPPLLLQNKLIVGHWRLVAVIFPVNPDGLSPGVSCFRLKPNWVKHYSLMLTRSVSTLYAISPTLDFGSLTGNLGNSLRHLCYFIRVIDSQRVIVVFRLLERSSNARF